MGNDIQPGHTYSTSPTGRQVSVENLNAHVGEAVLKETVISARTLKDPAQLSDQLLIADGALKRITLQVLFDLFGDNLVVGSSQIGSEAVTNIKIAPAALFANHVNGDMIHGQSEKTSPVGDDEILIWDSASTQPRRVKRSNFSPAQAAGSIVQSVYAEYTANANLTTVLPCDDTIPQNTEGTEILALAITPTSASSILRCRLTGYGTAGQTVGVAFFKDADVSAFAASAFFTAGGGQAATFHMESNIVAGTTSTLTFKVRIGPSAAGTLRLNGITSGRFFGGISGTSLVIEEIKA